MLARHDTYPSFPDLRLRFNTHMPPTREHTYRNIHTHIFGKGCMWGFCLGSASSNSLCAMRNRAAGNVLRDIRDHSPSEEHKDPNGSACVLLCSLMPGRRDRLAGHEDGSSLFSRALTGTSAHQQHNLSTRAARVFRRGAGRGSKEQVRSLRNARQQDNKRMYS